MESELITKIRTVYDRDMLVDELEFLKNSLYAEQGTGITSKLRTHTRFWVAEIIMKETDVNDINKVEVYFAKIIEKLRSFNVITLTLAFEPTEVSIDKFHDYIKRNMGENILIEFELDQRILGGAQITYDGKFKDLSLKRLFEDEYESQQVEVMKIMYSK